MISCSHITTAHHRRLQNLSFVFLCVVYAAGVTSEAVVHFLGGAFVGAAPQLSYRSLLEALSSRGVTIITTPFATSFDQLRTADEVQYKFDRCCRALEVGQAEHDAADHLGTSTSFNLADCMVGQKGCCCYLFVSDNVLHRCKDCIAQLLALLSRCVWWVC